MGGVIAVAALGVRAYTESLERSTERTKALGEALAQAFLGTSADVQEYVRAANAQIAANTAVRDSLKELAKDAPSQLNVTVDEFANSLNSIRETLGIPLEVSRFDNAAMSQEAFNATIAEYEKKIQLGQIAVDAYTGALDSSSVATNTAAEALRKLSEAQVDAAQKTLAIDRMTAEQRGAEVARNQRDIEMLLKLQNAAETSTEAAEALSVQIGVLTVRNRELTSVLTSTADLQAREKQFRDNAAKALQAYNDQLKIEAEALSRAEDIRQRISELTTDYEEKRRLALEDAEEKRREITADGAERRQEIDRDDAERRADILKQFNRSYGDAIANRDALAAVKAKEQRDDELEKQDKAYRKQLDQLDKQMEKQFRAVQQGLDKQQRSIDDAYNRQLRGLQQDLAEQNAIAENARQQAIVLDRNYRQLVEQAEVMHRAAQFKTIYDYGEMTGVYLDNLWRRIAEGARNLAQGYGVPGGPDNGYPGASVGGNRLGGGGAYSTMQAGRSFPPLSSMPTNLSLSIAPSRRSAPNINVVINTPTFDAAAVEKLWPPIRRKILDAI